MAKTLCARLASLASASLLEQALASHPLFVCAHRVKLLHAVETAGVELVHDATGVIVHCRMACAHHGVIPKGGELRESLVKHGDERI